MNPFLYAWRLPKYRKAFQHFFIQLKKRLCNSDAQPHTNNSPQFLTTEHKQNTPDSFNMHSLPHHENSISSTNKQVVGSSALRNVQEHFYRIEGNSTENTWL